MTSIDVHKNVSEIGGYCFSWNASLVSANVRTSVTPGTNVFANCTKLGTVILADLNTIPDSMFHTCSKLTTIEIPETVTSIGAYAFLNAGLTSIEIPSNVTSLGTDCFSGCTKLGDINSLPLNAPSLGTGVFGNSSTNYVGSKASVKRLDVPSNASGYEAGDWFDVLQDKVGFILYKEL
jgi:hypothetical protein